MTYMLRTVGLSLLAVVTIACHKPDPTLVPRAEAAVEVFHERYGREDWTAIYRDSHSSFQGVTTEAQFIKTLGDARRLLGPVVSKRKATEGTLASRDRAQVKLTYETEFTSGRATETFVWEIAGPKVELRKHHLHIHK